MNEMSGCSGNSKDCEDQAYDLMASDSELYYFWPGLLPESWK
ncbi:hypothetical protein [Paenibacillus sp. FSL R10-2734]